MYKHSHICACYDCIRVCSAGAKEELGQPGAADWYTAAGAVHAVNSFHGMQISKKDLPPNFKEHTITTISSQPVSTQASSVLSSAPTRPSSCPAMLPLETTQILLLASTSVHSPFCYSQAQCIPEYNLTLSSTALVLINLPYGLVPGKQVADPNHWDAQPFCAHNIQQLLIKFLNKSEHFVVVIFCVNTPWWLSTGVSALKPSPLPLSHIIAFFELRWCAV